MLGCRLKNQFTYWFVIFPLTIYGFPKRGYSQEEDIRRYCSCYPHLYNNDIPLNDEEFSTSLYQRHQTAKEMFSLSNFSLIIFVFHIIIFNCQLLFSFLLTLAIYLNLLNSVWGTIVVLSIVTACLYLIFSKVYVNGLYINYSSILCVFEATYICQELENNKILVDNSRCNSLKQRIKNLSKLVEIHGKISQTYRFKAMSLDISNKIDWLNDPIDSTLDDVNNYFKGFRYYWIIGKTGKIKVDNTLLVKQNLKEIKRVDSINKKLELFERSLSFLGRIKKLFIYIFWG